MCVYAGTKKRRFLLLEVRTKRIKEAPPLPPVHRPYEHKKKGSRPDYMFREILDRNHTSDGGQVLAEKTPDRRRTNGVMLLFKKNHIFQNCSS